MVHDLVPEGDEVSVHLVTDSDEETCIRQNELLTGLVESFTGTRVALTFKLKNFHARSITTDTGWKITMERGLDFFQWFEAKPLSLETSLQEARLVKGTGITYLRV